MRDPMLTLYAQRCKDCHSKSIACDCLHYRAAILVDLFELHEEITSMFKQYHNEVWPQPLARERQRQLLIWSHRELGVIATSILKRRTRLETDLEHVHFCCCVLESLTPPSKPRIIQLVGQVKQKCATPPKPLKPVSGATDVDTFWEVRKIDVWDKLEGISVEELLLWPLCGDSLAIYCAGLAKAGGRDARVWRMMASRAGAYKW